MAMFKSRMDVILQLTHWLNGHWEDPSWGCDHLKQAVLGATLHELASGITDAEIQKQVSNAAERLIAKGV